jgi:PAS domain S-box-containing protein
MASMNSLPDKNIQPVNAESYEDRFNRIAATLPCAIYEYYLDRNGISHFIYFNDQFLDILGLTRDGLTEKSLDIWSYIHLDDVARLAEHDLETKETGEKFFIEIRIITPLGKEKWVQVSSHQTNKVIDGVYTRSGYVMDITDRKHAEFELLRVQEEMKLHAIEDAKNMERSLLIRDMHDGLGSQLTYARMMIENDQIEKSNLLDAVQDCISDLYSIIDTLSEKDSSLFDILVDFRYRFQKKMQGINLQIHWDMEPDKMPALKQRDSLQILRILQEALNNSIRHGRAKSISVSARSNPSNDLFMLKIEDNGKGFDTSIPSGRGISNMRKRAKEIGAQLEVDSSEAGTRVNLTLKL